jgi:hypothetical protein
MTTYAGSAADPGEYGKLIAARLCPNTLPYELGTSAAFEVASFNGRALGDDALDVMLTLATNTPLVDGLAPDRVRIRKDFPYYGVAVYGGGAGRGDADAAPGQEVGGKRRLRMMLGIRALRWAAGIRDRSCACLRRCDTGLSAAILGDGLDKRR